MSECRVKGGHLVVIGECGVVQHVTESGGRGVEMEEVEAQRIDQHEDQTSVRGRSGGPALSGRRGWRGCIEM